MSPEQFHDALNFLDDDLIAQTDELRQGKRVMQTRPTVRQIIAWVASAACLVLVIGLAPKLVPTMESGNAVNMGNDQIYQEAGEVPQELEDYMPSITGDSSRHDNSLAIAVRQIDQGDISVQIPEDWIDETEISDDGSYYLLITPPKEEGAIRIGYDPQFGVCGTGLTTEETVIAGMDACVGTYDGNKMWSFITFAGKGEGYVVVNESRSWWGAYGDTVMEILETLVIG